MRGAEYLFKKIEARRAELGLSQAELGKRALGQENSAAIQNIRRGSSPTYDKLLAIADALDFELYFGPRRQGDVGVQGFSEPSATILISDQSFEVIGTGSHSIAFPAEFFEALGSRASDLDMRAIADDRMSPGLPTGTHVAIDKTKTDPDPVPKNNQRRSVPIYLCSLGGQQIACRLERQDGAHYLAAFDNPQYPPCYLRVLDLKVEGRVVWCGRTVKEDHP